MVVLVALEGDKQTIENTSKVLGAEELVLLGGCEQVGKDRCYNLHTGSMEELITLIEGLVQIYGAEQIYVHGSTGPEHMYGTITCAAFVNGCRVVVTDGSEVRLLPPMQLSYESPVTPKKLNILKCLLEKDYTVEELAKKNRMSQPLVTFHMNGNRKSKGLVEMGLVEKRKKRGLCNFRLSTLGELLVNGYVKPATT